MLGSKDVVLEQLKKDASDHFCSYFLYFTQNNTVNCFQ